MYFSASDFETSQAVEANKNNPKDAIEDPLFKMMCIGHTLEEAWQSVKRNKGSGGSDGQTIASFAQNVENLLPTLKGQLETGRYKPSLIRGKQIPKPNGGVRQLRIPTIRDRILQQALKTVIEPYFEPSFSTSSYVFRPKRSAQEDKASFFL